MIKIGSNLSSIKLLGHCLIAEELKDNELTQLIISLSSKNFNWKKFCRIAGTHWLSPYLHYTFEKSDLMTHVPAEVLTELQAVRQLTEVRNQRIVNQLQQLVSVLNQNDICPLLLKGASYLLHPISQIQKLRMTSDIDLFVPKTSISHTIETLKIAGYSFMNFLPDGTDYHLDPLIKGGVPARVELHIQPLSMSSRDLVNAENAWHNAELIELNNLRYFVFKPEFRVIHQFAHAQLHSRDHANERLDLRQLFDFYLMQNKYSKTVNWPLIDEKFSVHHKQVWADYILIANLIFSGPETAQISHSIEQRLRAEKMIRKLSGEPRRYAVYNCCERLMRLPPRLTSFDWYRTKLNYLMNKF